MNKSKSFFKIAFLILVFVMSATMAHAMQGVLHERDKQGAPITLEWKLITKDTRNSVGLESTLHSLIPLCIADEKQKEISDRMRDKKGSLSAQEEKDLELLFTGIVTYLLHHEIGEFISFDEEENYYLVVAKDAGQNILGFTAFCIKPKKSSRSAKIDYLAIAAHANKQHLAQLLAFSLLKLNKEIKHIVSTDSDYEAMLESIGFKKSNNGYDVEFFVAG